MPKKPENNKETYDFKEKEPEKTIEEQIDEKMLEWEKQDQQDDLHILDIAKNPPEPGYMRAELKKAVLTTKDEDDMEIKIDALALPLNKETTEDGTIIKEPPKDDMTIYKNCNGDTLQAYDTILDIDLAQIWDTLYSAAHYAN